MLDPTHEVALVVCGQCCLKTKVLGLSGPDVMGWWCAVTLCVLATQSTVQKVTSALVSYPLLLPW